MLEAGTGLQFYRQEIHHRAFTKNLAKFFRAAFLAEPLWGLLLLFFSYLLFEFSPVKMQEKESSLERKHKIICFLFPSNFFTVRTLWERERHTHYFEKRAMGLKIRFFESAIFRHHSLWKYVFVTQLLYFLTDRLYIVQIKLKSTCLVILSHYTSIIRRH